MSMTDMEANSLVRGLIFAVQKTRSDIVEAMGDSDVAQNLLKDTNPLLFGNRAILPHLLKWQENCDKSGRIAGADLFNFVTLIDRSPERAVLGLLAVYGYTTVPLEGPPVEWFTQSWPYLSA